jgi:hypothetical protein
MVWWWWRGQTCEALPLLCARAPARCGARHARCFVRAYAILITTVRCICIQLRAACEAQSSPVRAMPSAMSPLCLSAPHQDHQAPFALWLASAGIDIERLASRRAEQFARLGIWRGKKQRKGMPPTCLLLQCSRATLLLRRSNRAAAPFLDATAGARQVALPSTSTSTSTAAARLARVCRCVCGNPNATATAAAPPSRLRLAASASAPAAVRHLGTSASVARLRSPAHEDGDSQQQEGAQAVSETPQEMAQRKAWLEQLQKRGLSRGTFSLCASLSLPLCLSACSLSPLIPHLIALPRLASPRLDAIERTPSAFFFCLPPLQKKHTKIRDGAVLLLSLLGARRTARQQSLDEGDVAPASLYAPRWRRRWRRHHAAAAAEQRAEDARCALGEFLAKPGHGSRRAE